MILLQHWHGFVVDIDAPAGTFWARLADVSHPENPELEMEIITSALSQDEQKHVAQGAIFDWFIEQPEGSTTECAFSRFEFSKAVWTQEEIDCIQTEVERFNEFFQGT